MGAQDRNMSLSCLDNWLHALNCKVLLLQVLVGVCTQVYIPGVFSFTDSHTRDAATDWAGVVLPILPSSADLPQAQEGQCWGA